MSASPCLSTCSGCAFVAIKEAREYAGTAEARCGKGPIADRDISWVARVGPMGGGRCTRRRQSEAQAGEQSGLCPARLAALRSAKPRGWSFRFPGESWLDAAAARTRDETIACACARLSGPGNNEHRSKRTIYPVKSFGEKTSFIFALSSRKAGNIALSCSFSSLAHVLDLFVRHVHFFSLTCDYVTDCCCCHRCCHRCLCLSPAVP